MDVDPGLLGSSAHLRSPGSDPFLVMGGFLIAFPAVGFLVWTWAFWSQPRGRRAFKENCLRSFSRSSVSSVQSVHCAVASLLAVDVLNGVASIVLGSGFIDHCLNGRLCAVSSDVFYLSRSFSIVLHLVAALVSILHMCHPLQGSDHRYIGAAVSVVVVVTSPIYVHAARVAFVMLAIVILTLTMIVSVKSHTPVATPSLTLKKNLVVFAASVTSWVVFFPSFVLDCLVLNGSTGLAWTYLKILFYSSFNVIVDGVLCAAILSLSSEEEQQQQPPPQCQQPPPQWQQPPPQWQQPPPQCQQPPPQWQQPPPQCQQPPPEFQQPPPEFQQSPPEKLPQPPPEKLPPEFQQLPPEFQQPHPEQ